MKFIILGFWIGHSTHNRQQTQCHGFEEAAFPPPLEGLSIGGSNLDSYEPTYSGYWVLMFPVYSGEVVWDKEWVKKYTPSE